MAARTQHIVTAALIVARTGSTERYFDRGAILPEDVNVEERKRLVGLGLVKAQKVEELAEPTPPSNQPPANPPVDPNK